MNVQKEITDKYDQQNVDFLKEFIKLYQDQGPEKAKCFYYNEKVSINIDTDEGTNDKNTLLRKYLEGLQWVLYYYYKGVQHWRWYYPYHYAPLISDLGRDLVNDVLKGQEYIDHFQTDYNCAEPNAPYTPF